MSVIFEAICAVASLLAGLMGSYQLVRYGATNEVIVLYLVVLLVAPREWRR